MQDQPRVASLHFGALRLRVRFIERIAQGERGLSPNALNLHQLANGRIDDVFVRTEMRRQSAHGDRADTRREQNRH